LTEFKMAEYVPGTVGRVSVDGDQTDETDSESVEEEEEEECLSKYLDLHCKCYFITVLS
jgi:hypothetical protein